MSIASELTLLQQDITAARTAITNKGGTVTSGGGSSQLATDIGTIITDPSGDATAVASDVLSGKTAYSQGSKITGTMANNGATTGTISTQGGTFTIPEGYHNGKGKITATLPSGSTGTPTAVKGTVSNNSVSVTPSVTSSTGYITGDTKTGTAVTVSASELVSGTLTLTAGTSASTGNDCTNYASVTINPTPTETKTVTANGTVTPSSGKFLSSVTVNVPSPTTSVTYSNFVVNGDWTNTQTKGAAVDITGLIPTATFNGTISASKTETTPVGNLSLTSSGNNSVSGAVTGFTYSPQTWSASGDLQTCTFSYTYNSVTKTATKDYSWGSSYLFYTSDYTQITDITVSGLANAYYYKKNGGDYQRVGGRIFYIDSNASGASDKFYVADSTNAMRKYDGTNYCMWATAGEDLSSYSSVFDVLSSAQTTVGTGKRNTAWINSNRNNSTYFPAHNSVSGKVTCWDFAKSCNENSVNGCTDWFVPSCGEVTQLRQSGIWGSSLADWVNTTKYGSNSISYLWSSSAYSSSNTAWGWCANVAISNDQADYYTRITQFNRYLLCAVRAF